MNHLRNDPFTYVRAADGVLYGIHYIPHKFLKIKRCGDPERDANGAVIRDARGHIKRRRETARLVVCYDVSGYWQTSFLEAITTWNVGTSEERAIIAQGKRGRSTFSLPLSPEIIDYNALECKLLAELMHKLDQAAERSMGIRLRKYHGAGTLASELLAKHGITEYTGIAADRPPWLRDAIDRAFFGGRFETSAIGVVPTLYEFDIASAYPAAMTTLPCLRHGYWTHHEASDLAGQPLPRWSVVRVRWNTPRTESFPFGPFPYRCKDGSLIYPPAGHGWYWRPEVEAAQDVFGDYAIDVLEASSWTQTCDHQPFSWIPELYLKRLELGKDGEGLVVKYALNSLYGKIAQTAGGGSPFTDFAWAGLITSATRATLLRFAGRGGPHTIMLATDAVYVDAVTPEIAECITYSDKAPLGEWEHNPDEDVHHDALIIQSGVWLSAERLKHHHGRLPEGTKAPKERTRGIGAQLLGATDGYRRLYLAWYRDGLDAVVHFGPNHVAPGEKVPTYFVGLRSALHRGKRELAGTWQPDERRIRFAPEPKRDRAARQGTCVRTLPPLLDGEASRFGVAPMLQLSAPYKRLARKEGDRALFEDQPDYVDTLDLLAGSEG